MAFSRRRAPLMDEASLYEYAVAALGRRMRSVAEMKRLLRQRVEDNELGHALVEMVVVRLKDQKYLNDSQYASAFSSYRRDNEKFGRLRVISELKARGVHGDVIDKSVGETYSEVNEEKQARDHLRRKRLKKPVTQKETARIFRALVRAGFRAKTIFTILKKWDVDDETLTALQSEASEI
jgi:regulatory protein